MLDMETKTHVGGDVGMGGRNAWVPATRANPTTTFLIIVREFN